MHETEGAQWEKQERRCRKMAMSMLDIPSTADAFRDRATGTVVSSIDSRDSVRLLADLAEPMPINRLDSPYRTLLMVNGPRFRSPKVMLHCDRIIRILLLLKWNAAVGDDPLSGDALNGGIGGGGGVVSV